MASVPARSFTDVTVQSERGNPHWTRHPGDAALDAIPGDDGLPIVGTTFRQLADPIGFGNAMLAKYGPVYRTRSFGRRGVTLVGPDANELVLFDRDKLFSNEQGWGPILNLLFPRGLMLMDHEAHRIDRRALSIAFKPEPMRAYCGQLNEQIARGVDAWGKGAGANGVTQVRFYDLIKTLTLQTAAVSFLGLPLGPEADRLNKAFVDMVQASVAPIRRPLPFTAMGRGVAGRKLMVEYFTRLVRERREKPGQDMFSQFALATREDGSLLAEDVVVDHMIFLMMAAHDTITSSFTTLAWHLATSPEWQDKLRAEALAVTGGPDRALAYEDLGKLELTDLAFKESLRIMPPVPAMPRRALRDFTFRGHRIPAGTGVGISPAAVHADPALWPDPDRFDPLRFTPDKVAARHKYAWVPFGGGAHMCLGLHFATMQTKVLVAQILSRYALEAAPGYAPKWQAWPIPKPRDGLRLSLRRLG
ncbi:cytochrome P450 [Novosphingobium huizhouense]|uniref:cytochrome P450 n=1 Tax=Novosphingobium huizhouense TaxID=2866625 RepID=UPI001CD85CEC|nr:cytochrome P450 [Novosphingobium huizhouense]